jgi:regulatory protein
VVITGLRADTRVSGSVIVEADGARIASLPAEVVRELELEVGADLSPAQQADVLHASAVEGARRVALRLLATRPRAIQDLRRRLRDRGHEPTVIKQAVERLQSSGLLDDVEFARHYVRVRSPRGLGPSRLVHDLLVVGVDRAVAEQAVRDVEQAEGIDIAAQARELAQRRATQLASLPVERRRRRLLVFLARRGFTGHEVRQMVAELIRSN